MAVILDQSALNLQKAYISKYYTTKNVSQLISMIEYDYLDWLKNKNYTDNIINTQVDMIIFLMTKEHFQRIIRSTLILMQIDNSEKQSVTQLLQDKQYAEKIEVLERLGQMFPSFLSYFVIAIYSFI
jgi:hypothetical protein